MILEINANIRSRHPNPEIIEKGLKDLKGVGDSFAILSKSQTSYMQTAGSPASGFALEYHTESPEQHFRCSSQNLDLESITRAFTYYLQEDARYLVEFRWQEQDLNTLRSAPSGALKSSTFVTISLKYPSTWIAIAFGLVFLYYIISRILR